MSKKLPVGQEGFGFQLPVGPCVIISVYEISEGGMALSNHHTLQLFKPCASIAKCSVSVARTEVTPIRTVDAFLKSAKTPSSLCVLVRARAEF